jgi:uncharacterized repeat protein (TIGR02543 family)
MAVMVTAQWTPTNYTISYTLNSGSVSGNPTSYNIETASFTLNNPTRTVHTFEGWTGSNGTTKQTTVTIPKGSTGNKSYTANWKVNTYTLTYNNQSGTGCSSKTGTYGSAWGALCTPTRAASSNYAYSFGGWYTGTNGSGTNITASSTISGNQTVYAKWNATYCSGKILADGKCWLVKSGSYTFNQAQSQCPSGYSVATRAQIGTLTDVYPYDSGALYTALGLSSNGIFWSSSTETEDPYNYAYILAVLSNAGVVSSTYQSSLYGVACVHS